MVNLRKIQKEIEREKAIKNNPMRIESQELALQNSTMRETEDIDRQATRIEKLINIQR